MRSIAYAIAALAAIGIAFVVANSSGPESETTSPASAVSASNETMQEAGTLTLAVPEMHCSFSCFPRVKETLESNPAVAAVELGPQKEEGTIDNRQVIVQYEPGFDLSQALTMLAKEGFTDSQAVQ
ncbi:hypothetical protein Pla22_15840 [Rubripirellula amarantea]|uniref:HMA domain-containing protein n=1 Tax=Rubripirellula amarantea TaxID=2527999 RepID=A0A5C5WTV1_9BACT|nr:heavy-metal-associated domain-containing protein [Rubripirellula amarantea]TWT53950.1 hypothetical protein Pla22_15840 [Rubripirellula amarantea]